MGTGVGTGMGTMPHTPQLPGCCCQCHLRSLDPTCASGSSSERCVYSSTTRLACPHLLQVSSCSTCRQAGHTVGPEMSQGPLSSPRPANPCQPAQKLRTKPLAKSRVRSAHLPPAHPPLPTHSSSRPPHCQRWAPPILHPAPCPSNLAHPSTCPSHPPQSQSCRQKGPPSPRCAHGCGPSAPPPAPAPRPAPRPEGCRTTRARPAGREWRMW